MITPDQIDAMLQKARAARENAFVPRSGHKIGASVLSTDGEIFGGCNIEINISGLGTCAERAAIDNAITHGKYEFAAVLALDEKQTVSCGACLQYLMQFYVITGSDIAILTADTKGKITQHSLLQVLPYHYLPQHNLEEIKSYRNKK